jgi:hypothetical protein
VAELLQVAQLHLSSGSAQLAVVAVVAFPVRHMHLLLVAPVAVVVGLMLQAELAQQGLLAKAMVVATEQQAQTARPVVAVGQVALVKLLPLLRSAVVVVLERHRL